MAKAMKTKDFDRALRDAGCSVRPGKGSHVVYYCQCELKHMVTVNVGHGTVAPNAMRDVKHKMPCVSNKLTNN